LAYILCCGRIANPSTSLVGFATCSFWAALLEPLAKRKKIQLLEIGLGLVVIIGLYIIFAGDFQYPLGLFSGYRFRSYCALFSVINSKLVVRINAHTITFYEMASACVIIFLFFPLYQSSWADNGQLSLSPLWSDWIYIAIMAWACSVYAYSAAINLTKKLSVFFIQLALNLEPVYGITLALIVFGNKEVMSLNFYAGTFIIISAVAIYPFLKNKTETQFK